MNIIFFGDTGDITPRCIFSGQEHPCFFFCQEGNVMLLTPTHIYRKYHISTCFLIKIIFFHFLPKEKISYFLEKINTLNTRYYIKDRVQARIFGKDHLSRTPEENIIFPGLKNKIIFSGKGNIIFPDNTRKIIFQCDFFGKTIFKKHLEKENMVFRVVKYKVC